MTHGMASGCDSGGQNHPARSQWTISEPTQLLTGLMVGLPSNRVVCTGCMDKLVEGEPIIVYGYRPAESAQWSLRRCYCPDCTPESIRHPTIGVTELLARAWLGSLSLPRTRTHRLCLTEVTVVAYSPPHEGAEP